MSELRAFWSYAHADNTRDGGRVLALADLVAAEYALLAGEELEIFSDRELQWGENWRDAIDEALAQSIFFVPVLSPTYFTREECREELLGFASRASSLGVSELILPIYYLPIPDFSPNSTDEAVALAASFQYEDWD